MQSRADLGRQWLELVQPRWHEESRAIKGHKKRGRPRSVLDALSRSRGSLKWKCPSCKTAKPEGLVCSRCMNLFSKRPYWEDYVRKISSSMDRNIGFTISYYTWEHVKKQRCKACWAKGPSQIDRVNNKKGYIAGNLQALCAWCNRTKYTYNNEYLHRRLLEAGKKSHLFVENKPNWRRYTRIQVSSVIPKEKPMIRPAYRPPVMDSNPPMVVRKPPT